MRRECRFQAGLLTGSAHNLVANWHRDQGRRKIIALDEYVSHPLKSEAPDRLTEEWEERNQLMEAVRRLPEDRQQLLLLKFVEQMSNREIGAIMGRTEGAVKSLYHRTLLALREEMVAVQTGDQKQWPGGKEGESYHVDSFGTAKARYSGIHHARLRQAMPMARLWAIPRGQSDCGRLS